MILFHKATGTYFDADHTVVVVNADAIKDAPPNYEMKDIADEFGRPWHDTHVVILGGPVQGYEFLGPFWGYQAALDFTYKLDESWVIAPLER